VRCLALALVLTAIGAACPVTAQHHCDPSYPGVCIPPPPPDLNCGDIEERDFEVVGRDPHGFDRDHDGIGCESR
jgi:micrococcal nuclease